VLSIRGKKAAPALDVRATCRIRGLHVMSGEQQQEDKFVVCICLSHCCIIMPPELAPNNSGMQQPLGVLIN
jgi:hypothetical protein